MERNKRAFEGKCSRMSSLVNTIQPWIKQSSTGDSCLGLEFDFNVVPNGYILKEVKIFDLVSSWALGQWRLVTNGGSIGKLSPLGLVEQ